MGKIHRIKLVYFDKKPYIIEEKNLGIGYTHGIQ